MAEQKTTPSGVTYTDFHSDTPESMKNEKRALLALMAEHGTEGQAEYERNKQITKDTRAASIEAAAARGAQVHAPGTLQAEISQDYDKVMAGLLANTDDGMLGHGREMDRIAAANAAYLDQVSGASQLNRDLLAEQIGGGSGGGGGGGGRGGGGGGGGGSQGYQGTPGVDGSIRTLEEAGGLAGGSENPGTMIDGVPVSGSGVRRLFGDEFDPDAPWGNGALVTFRENLTAARQAGVPDDELAETMMRDLAQRLEQGEISPHQFSMAASTMDNYLGITAEGKKGLATVNDYNVGNFAGSYLDERFSAYDEEYEAANPYTQEGRDRETNNLDRIDGLGSLDGYSSPDLRVLGMPIPANAGLSMVPEGYGDNALALVRQRLAQGRPRSERSIGSASTALDQAFLERMNARAAQMSAERWNPVTPGVLPTGPRKTKQASGPTLSALQAERRAKAVEAASKAAKAVAKRRAGKTVPRNVR